MALFAVTEVAGILNLHVLGGDEPVALLPAGDDHLLFQPEGALREAFEGAGSPCYRPAQQVGQSTGDIRMALLNGFGRHMPEPRDGAAGHVTRHAHRLAADKPSEAAKLVSQVLHYGQQLYAVGFG